MDEIIKKIEALKLADDSCGLKQNTVIDKVLELHKNYTCKNLYHPYEGHFECSECKTEWLYNNELKYERLTDPTKFKRCPECGRKIEGR